MTRRCLNFRTGFDVPKQCEKVPFQDGPMCRPCGCHVCGGIILADTEEWPHPLCASCFEDIERIFAVPMATRACWALLQDSEVMINLLPSLEPLITKAVGIARVTFCDEDAINKAHE